MGIHPLAVVHPTARLGRDCEVGPFCVIEQDVVMGDRCVLDSHVVIRRGVTLGDDNRISESSVLGALPQHIQARAFDGGLTIGSGNTFREYTTLHRSMHAGTATIVGDNKRSEPQKFGRDVVPGDQIKGAHGNTVGKGSDGLQTSL